MSVFKLPYSVTACIRYIRYLTVILYSIFQVLFYVNIILLELHDHVLILLVLLFQMLNVAKEKLGREHRNWKPNAIGKFENLLSMLSNKNILMKICWGFLTIVLLISKFTNITNVSKDWWKHSIANILLAIPDTFSYKNDSDLVMYSCKLRLRHYVTSRLLSRC